MDRALFVIAPLLLFYLAEARWGLRAGVIAALLAAGAELAHGWWRERRLRRTVLASFLLVLVIGGSALVADDPRFVLWSPVVMDLAIATLLTASLYGGGSALESALRERDPDALDPPMRRFLRAVTVRLALNLTAHGALTAWSTSQDRDIWFWVSGPLQYVMLGVQVLVELFAIRRLPPVRKDGSDVR